MFNSKIVSKHLKDTGAYPLILNQNNSGLSISAENGQLLISGSPCDLIDIADLLVSLALSGENVGQHWHLDELTLIAEQSPIGELIIERDDQGINRKMQGRFSIEGNCSTMKTFPDKLDNAIVLEFSEFGNFGTIKGDNRTVRYFAICQYPNDASYYLFFCAGYDYDFDVIIDDLGETIEMCKKIAAQYGDVIWHKK